jgi:adenylylsulfate kinase-like enzyme
MTSKSFVTAEKGTGTSSVALESTASNRQRFVLSQVAQLVLFRGLPGAGKSTKARVLKEIGYKHFEADMFFEVDGVYRYNPSRIRYAHDWCKLMTRQALGLGERVVVSNTFTTRSEIQPYLEMGAESIRIVEADGSWENVHSVPKEVVERMASRWEKLPGGSMSICLGLKGYRESAHV